jgi:hypothetical protein
MSKSEIRRIEIQLREQIAQEIETMCQYKDSEELGCWEMDNYGDWYRSCTHKEDAAIARGMK